MRPVYAVQFQVLPVPGAPLSVDAILRMTCEWISGWYRHWKHIDVPVPCEPYSVDPLPLHKIRIERGTAGIAHLSSVLWSYPTDDDSGLLWESQITISQSGQEVVFSFVLRVGSTTFTVAPPSFDVRRPHLVKLVTTAFPCSLGPTVIRTSPQEISTEDVDGLVTTLRSPERRLPILLVSREPYSEKFYASPSRLADSLVGLAHVCAFTDKWASFRFSEHVGKLNGCFYGAVRLFWPGLDPDGTFRADRIYLPEEMEYLRDGVVQRLMRRLAPVSAFRFVELETTKRARAEIAQQQETHLSDLRKRASSGQAEREQLEAELLQLLDQLDVVKAEKQRVETERDDALLRAMELEDERQRLDDNVKALTQFQGKPLAKHDSVPPSAETEPDSVSAALSAAAQRFSSRLLVWPSADASAEESDYARPTQVFEVLWAINDLAEAYFVAKPPGRGIGPWEDYFEQKGFRYAAKESKSTNSRYGEQRDFTYDGTTRRMQRHITIGGGDRKNCLQIYFDVDEKAERFIIGHCGRHLDTGKYN